MPEKFSGVLTPVITPFKEDFSPDSKRLLKQCKWMLSHNDVRDPAALQFLFQGPICFPLSKRKPPVENDDVT